jgi:Skp family chaperone for outer membrane proteins
MTMIEPQPVRRGALVCAFALAAAPTAWSQTAPVAAPAPPADASLFPNLGGAKVAGVCLVSREELVAHSKVGEAAAARFKVLAAQAQTTVDAEKARLEARGKALEAKRATLTPQQLQTEGLALQRRAQALQAEFTERQHQLETTRARSVARVLEAARPFVADAYAAHKCGLLLAREAVLGGAMADDLTPEVLTAFDAKGTPISLDLEPGK